MSPLYLTVRCNVCDPITPPCAINCTRQASTCCHLCPHFLSVMLQCAKQNSPIASCGGIRKENDLFPQQSWYFVTVSATPDDQFITRSFPITLHQPSLIAFRISFGLFQSQICMGAYLQDSWTPLCGVRCNSNFI